jgi:ABC-2 type transport system ATP-binding protein
MSEPSSAESREDWRGWPIETRALTKRYRQTPVVDSIDLIAGPGETYGFLGPNGAGKTTTMRMLLDLVRRDAGAIRLFGPRRGRRCARGASGRHRDHRGASPLSVPQRTSELQLLSDLDLARAGGRRLEEVLETVELRDRAKDRVSECLQGMRQRLGIAACLVRNPKLMPLDEPAKGVDPAGMRFLRQLLLRLREEGLTVLTSSHLLAEVQEICTRVAFISAGRIAYEGPLDDLLARAGRRYRLETSQLERTAEICRDVAGLSVIEVDPDRIGFAVDGERALVELDSALAEAEIAIEALTPEQVTLERVFFELTETSMRPEEAIAR